eukprot:4656943-Pleurochrysis_carterae.AAC.1
MSASTGYLLVICCLCVQRISIASRNAKRLYRSCSSNAIRRPFVTSSPNGGDTQHSIWEDLVSKLLRLLRPRIICFILRCMPYYGHHITQYDMYPAACRIT